MDDPRVINPPELAPPVGFSHGIEAPAGRWVYIAGQNGTDGEGRIVAPTDLVAQADAALANVVTVLRAAGGDASDVAKMELYVTDMDAYRDGRKDLGTVWRRHFGRYYPAMTLVAVRELYDPQALIEIDAVAVIPQAVDTPLATLAAEVPLPEEARVPQATSWGGRPADPKPTNGPGRSGGSGEHEPGGGPS